jgi:hypothetical protein
MAVNILLRRGTAAEWTASNPILLEGEVGVETDSKKLKVGDGLTVWASLPYITLTPSAAASIYATIANPSFTGTVTLDTGVTLVFEGATANAFETTLTVADPTADRTLTLPDATGTLATQTYVTNEIGTHSSDTTSVHGIADTADLATKTYADTAVSTHSSDTTSVHGITDTLELATKTYADNAASNAVSTSLSTHTLDTLEVHGIADTSLLVTTTGTQTLTNKTITTPAGLVKSDVGLGNVDNTTDANKPVSTATQTALDLKAPLANPTFTGTVSGVTKSHVGLGNVDNTSDANKPISTATQTALDAKLASATAASTYAPLASPTFTGTVTLPANTISQSMMSDDSVGTNEIGGLAVTTEKIAALAITEGKIAALAVTEGKIADSAVTSAKIADGTIVNADINASAAIAQSKVADLTTDLAAKLPLAGGTMTGAITLSGDPTSELHATTKRYVDGLAAGINFHAPVVAATAGNLAGTYDNGTSGVGATLTKSSNGSIGTIDGATVAVGNRILLRAQTDAKQNGIYVITALGDGSHPWIITRAADADNNPSGELANGDFCFVTNGTTNGSKGFLVSTAGTITIGTTSITYSQFNASEAVVAGDGITKSGETISVASGGITSGMIADGTIVDADVNSAAAIAKTKISGTAITAADTGTVTSTMIADGTIVDADINASAAIAKTKISGTAITAGDTGTVTSTMIADGTIVDGDINASAAIAQSKISGLTAALGDKAPLASPTFTGTVTLPAAGIVFSDGTQALEGVPSRTPIIQKTASYTLSALTERDDLIEMSSSSALTLSIPTDATLNFPIGTSIDILQTGTGQVTIAAVTPGTTTVNATPGLKLRTTWSSATLFKRAANTWVVFGDLTA